MPVPTANISGDINAAIGEVSTIRVTAVYSDPVWADETNNAVIVGGGLIPVTADGLIDVNLPQTNDTVRVAIHLDYVDNATRQRKSASSGWQELTADVDLATFMATTPTSVPLSTAEALAARIDGYQDHGDVSGVLTIDPATGTHVLNATGSLLVTLDTAPNGRIVTLYIVGGATNVTVDGIAALELTDGAFASFVRIRGAWVLASAGASGTPANPDTTPPTAITDLVATGSEGQITLTFTYPTDDESTPRVGYKVWPTADTEPTTYITTATASPIIITDLPAGNYTAKIYSYSNGGTTTPDTATATVTTPPGWNNILADTFTGADGTLVGHVPNLSPNGAAWGAGHEPGSTAGWSDLQIISNAVSMSPTDAGTVGCYIDIPAGTRSGIGAGIDYDFVRQLDSGDPGMGLGFGPSIGLTKVDSTVTISATNPSVGAMTLTGTTTGHPLTGRLSYRAQGTALVIYINGVEACTATMAANWNAATRMVLNGYFLKRSKLDNLTIEVLTS